MKQSSSRALAALLLGAAITIGGCGDTAEPKVPGSLQVVTGDGQTAVAGTAVQIPPSIKLLTTTGKPLGGAQVTFASTDGIVTPPQVLTDDRGIATLTSWTLPKRAGSHLLTVSSEGVQPVNITATATVGAAAQITRSSPDAQTGVVGAIAGAAPAVLVTDGNGNPAAGVLVRFSPSGNGTVQTPLATTDENGIARSGVWTLGTVAGNQSVTAALETNSLVPVVTFNAAVRAGVPLRLLVAMQPLASCAGDRLLTAPVVEIRDTYNNRVLDATTPVTVSAAQGGTESFTGTFTVLPTAGRATFTDLAVTAAGSHTLHFTSGALVSATSARFDVRPSVAFNYALGQTTRFVGSDAATPACLDFPSINGGQQYLVQFENIATTGNSDTGVFPGSIVSQPGFPISVTTRTLENSNVVSNARVMQVPAAAVHSWDFGAGEIFEIEPPPPVAGVRPAMVVRNNTMFDASANSADVAVGDTVIASMVGIPRLGIADGAQKAVVRYVGPDLIIAEDVRLPTLTRQNGGTNTPLTMADIEAIAADYARYAKVQADLFFGGRYNSATEASGSKPIAIHSLMYADNIWGYTYPSGNYFVWDFWVGTDGQTKGLNQTIERNSNSLFMHEIAHMRHWGMNERANKYVRGNRWLVEGFARASERWPIAMRLLGTTDFSRTNNVVLPGYATTTLNLLEDVPVYTQASASMYAGYAASAYIFDYFADQVARSGNPNWRAALGDFLVNAGIESDLNAAIGRHLPGIDFGTLFTRARIALLTDDYVDGLPDWTQYHQYQLRASRQTLNPQLDPRNLWRRIAPGSAFSEAREVLPGTAFGYIVDGTAGDASTRLTVDLPRAPYSVLSVTRIK